MIAIALPWSERSAQSFKPCLFLLLHWPVLELLAVQPLSVQPLYQILSTTGTLLFVRDVLFYYDKLATQAAQALSFNDVSFSIKGGCKTTFFADVECILLISVLRNVFYHSVQFGSLNCVLSLCSIRFSKMCYLYLTKWLCGRLARHWLIKFRKRPCIRRLATLPLHESWW